MRSAMTRRWLPKLPKWMTAGMDKIEQGKRVIVLRNLRMM